MDMQKIKGLFEDSLAQLREMGDSAAQDMIELGASLEKNIDALVKQDDQLSSKFDAEYERHLAAIDQENKNHYDNSVSLNNERNTLMTEALNQLLNLKSRLATLSNKISDKKQIEGTAVEESNVTKLPDTKKKVGSASPA